MWNIIIEIPPKRRSRNYYRYVSCRTDELRCRVAGRLAELCFLREFIAHILEYGSSHSTVSRFTERYLSVGIVAVYKWDQAIHSS